MLLTTRGGQMLQAEGWPRRREATPACESCEALAALVREQIEELAALDQRLLDLQEEAGRLRNEVGDLRALRREHEEQIARLREMTCG